MEMSIVKTYSDGTFLEFDKGAFNDWCVYYNDGKGKRTAPLDSDYFQILKQLSMSSQFKNNNIYEDFVKIYNLVIDKNWNNDSLIEITKITDNYPEKYRKKMNILYTILYMGMVAEENWEGTKLGKRIKRLGVHALLIDGMSVYKAANFMRGLNWKEVDKLCRERGF